MALNLNKDRVYIVSSNVDDSIRTVSIYTDISIFKTFKAFEDYINTNPIDAGMIIVNSKDLPFTSTSLTRMIGVINSSFVSLSGYLYYLVDDLEIQEKCIELCKKHDYTKLKCIYSETLYAKDVADILTGESLSSKETVTEIKTYRIRASEYIRSQKDKEGIPYDDQYLTDEDQLSGIQDVELPEDLRATDAIKVVRCDVCGDNLRELCSWVILKAQYLALKGKVLVVEKDYKYHTLYDMISKLNIEYAFFDIVDMYKDLLSVLDAIKESNVKIIFIGTKYRINYDYNTLLDLLVYNLDTNIDYYIYQNSLSQIPYGCKVDVVTPITVPEILKCVNSMSTISSYEDIHFVGLDITNLGHITLSEFEYRNLIEQLLEYNNLNCSVARIHGLLLKTEVGLGGILMYE